MKNIEPCYYGDYLQLDKIWGADLQSEKYGDAAHEESCSLLFTKFMSFGLSRFFMN